MISPKLVKILNDQVKLELAANMQYLAMASWAEVNGYNGVATFFFKQSAEERTHMLKLVNFINERGKEAIIPEVTQPPSKFETIKDIFTIFLESEQQVTMHIQQIVSDSLDEKNYIVHNFMQWFLTEQLEEETLARTILDKLKMIGTDKGGLYLFDRDLGGLAGE